MPPKRKVRIDRDWFLARLRDRKLSMRQLSKDLCLDASAVSLILSVKRDVSPGEIKSLADLLLVAPTEIMRALGIDVAEDVRRVPVAGHITKDSVVILHATGTEETVVGPADLPHDAIAVQFRTVGSSTYWRDGWLAFFSNTRNQPQECLGKISIIAEQHSGKIYFAVLDHGYKTGLYNIVFAASGSDKMLENVAVAWCSPVLWIKPRR